MTKIHLDTDLGGDIDDLCALAMLLRWSENLQLVGITTVGDTHGRRAGYVRYVLGLEGQEHIPVAAGAENFQGYYPYELGLPPEPRYWPEPVPPSPNPIEHALQLLKNSIEQGATLIGIGPLTNFYLLDRQYPGILQQARLFLMAGYIYPTRPGFPEWGNAMDFNVQIDVRSARHVLQNSNPTLIPLSVTVETALRWAHLAELRQAGALGQLLACQAQAFAEDEQIGKKYAPTCAALPSDIINFQHDPLACAVALGWEDGIEIQELPLILDEVDGLLVEQVHLSGKPIRLVTRVDGPLFNDFWLRKITRRDV